MAEPQAQPKSQNTIVKFTTVNGSVDSFTLDATLSQARDLDADVTDYPVEVGSDRTDHVRVKPEVYKLEVLVTDYPLPHSDASSVPGQASRTDGRAQAIFDRFVRAQAKADAVDVVAPNYSLSGYVVKTLSHTLTKENNKAAIKFTCTLRQIITATSQRVKLEIPKVNKAKAKETLGKQNGTTPSAPEQSESLAYKGLGALGVIVR